METLDITPQMYLNIASMHAISNTNQLDLNHLVDAPPFCKGDNVLAFSRNGYIKEKIYYSSPFQKGRRKKSDRLSP